MCARVLSGSRTSSYRDRATSSASSLADKTRARRVQSRERTASLFCGPIDGTQKQKRGPPGSGGFGYNSHGASGHLSRSSWDGLG